MFNLENPVTLAIDIKLLESSVHPSPAIKSLKTELNQARRALGKALTDGVNISSITQQLVSAIDAVIRKVYKLNHLDKTDNFCLLALGSYGREELQLYSDVDLLIIHDSSPNPMAIQQAESFIQQCWDLGLEISHQIIGIGECVELASSNLSVISSLLDARFLQGQCNLFESLKKAIARKNMWSGIEYFKAKLQEQQQRHQKYGNSAYSLEPNIKHTPGGLRDIQILSHVIMRHFGHDTLRQSITSGCITIKEHRELIQCQQFLFRTRFALHWLVQKREERLLFDHQLALAKFFGYEDTPEKLAIEQFMKVYFSVTKRVQALNQIVLQWFSETILPSRKQASIAISPLFTCNQAYISANDHSTFMNHPIALLDLFVWIAKDSSIQGIRTGTIRLIQKHLDLIDPDFRDSQAATTAFMTILKSPNTYTALQLMNHCGVLGRYLTCFAAVTGQMQFDLFHAFTVEQHTLFVIQHLNRLMENSFSEQFPLSAQLFKNIPKKDVLYLSALFHDIGKGQGGSHENIGAIEAKKFSVLHNLPIEDEQLLTWLVRNHLLMSHTAQRQDIYDPHTIEHFCSLFPKAEYLDYLYLLTVADICATNPRLWNNWKGSLLKELYYTAQKALERQPLTETKLLEKRRQDALAILTSDGFETGPTIELWKHIKNKYFLHEPSEVIAKHAKAILTAKQFPLILISPHYTKSSTEIFMYLPHQDNRFMITTTILSNYQATIQEATILTCDNAFDIDTYVILDEHTQHSLSETRAEHIQRALLTCFLKTTPPALKKRRIPRVFSHFQVETRITFSKESDTQTRMFILTLDTPGLLAKLSRVFLDAKISLHNAKISTAGERAEDTFYISNQHEALLSAEEEAELADRIRTTLKK